MPSKAGSDFATVFGSLQHTHRCLSEASFEGLQCINALVELLRTK